MARHSGILTIVFKFEIVLKFKRSDFDMPGFLSSDKMVGRISYNLYFDCNMCGMSLVI